MGARSCFRILVIRVLFMGPVASASADCPPDRALQDIVLTRAADNPIIRPSAPGDPDFFPTDTGDVLHQCVRRKDASSPYMMWYTGSPAVPPGGFAERRIHLAISEDGIHFTKLGPVLSRGAPGSFDDVQVHMPTVLWKDGEWKMWYSGHQQKNCGPCTPEQSAGWNTVGYATSADGIHWTKFGRVFDVNPDLSAFDSDTIREPTVLFDERDQLYKMWYDGTRHGEHFGPVGYATSPDGIHWTRVAQVSTTPDRLRGGVIRVGDYFYMFYNIGPNLGYSVSVDGIHWSDYPGNPIMTPAAGTWEQGYLQAPSLVYLESQRRLYMYYNAWDGVSEKIGMASMPFVARMLPLSSVGDYDGDGDMDLTDFGRMQRCLGHTSTNPLEPDCESLTLDCDYDVDQADLSRFIGCLGGPGHPFDPACGD